MALGCHGALKMLLEKQRKGKWIWTWTNWLAWLVQCSCMDSILGKVEVQGFVVVAQVNWGPAFERPFARPIMGYASPYNHMSLEWGVGPGWVICRIPPRLFHFDEWEVFYGLWSFITYVSHLRKRGPLSPADLYPKGGICETLARRAAVEWYIVKALSWTLDLLPSAVRGGIDECRTN